MNLASSLRALALVAAGLSAAACTTAGGPKPVAYAPEPAVDADAARMYGALEDGGWTIPAADLKKMAPRNVRQVVDFRTDEPVGTVVVDPRARFLYLVMPGGRAMRYGVGVGKAGLEFTGEGIIQRKAAWPHWTPTPDMIRREPEKYGGELRNGMDGGIQNPLGARALYLFKDGQDTLFRIHGTNQAWSIGKAVSSGCIRMLNQDVIDLNNRVPPKTRVVVLGAPATGATS
ncbi:L,D-transpeptidase [Aureimonas sp. N4]|uniref:L,D-transpeptidase n=1 Tax=Aureimonas sp. N4 TaxID=1638165 RepID=UPI000780D6FB|nr:L,D-transpeptidase [Aureimonas sp. N4]